ncbi:hypothetical protein HPP92_010663 [Vanilla planifolia]|uniref:Uncharacterized protein n=1 Tax=Vanilla planifolia TaxID=51239 RepID=A0A835R5J8_VANPL|nr:hypothetical protein HPP92_010663 [Vanilla planifolia]
MPMKISTASLTGTVYQTIAVFRDTVLEEVIREVSQCREAADILPFCDVMFCIDGVRKILIHISLGFSDSWKLSWRLECRCLYNEVKSLQKECIKSCSYYRPSSFRTHVQMHRLRCELFEEPQKSVAVPLVDGVLHGTQCFTIFEHDRPALK